MARPMMRFPTPCSQRYGTAKQENKASILLAKKHEDIKNNKVIVDYEPEGSDPSDKPDAQQEEVDSEA